MAAVTALSHFGTRKKRICPTFTFPPSICHEVMGPDAMILVFWMLNLNQLFCSPLSSSSRGSLVTFHFLPLKWYHLHICRGCRYFSWQSWFQSGISRDVLCIEVKYTGWHYMAMMHSFPSLELVHCSMSSSNCCFLTRIQVSQGIGKVV